MTKSADWFASWFDSPYYHLLYAHRDESEASKLINELIAYLDPPENSKILDLCCGKGRHTAEIARKGYEVTGADLSVNSIERAKSNYPEGRFVVHDMRAPINFGSFDIVFNLFTSFGYFDDIEDNSKVLSSVNAAMHEGGILIIDYLNARKVIQSLVKSERLIRSEIEFEIERRVENGVIIKRINFSDQGTSYTFEEKVQALELEDFRTLLTDNGFEIVNVFGNYSLTSFDENESDRLILCARKV